jgi:hypothetical protein
MLSVAALALAGAAACGGSVRRNGDANVGDGATTGGGAGGARDLMGTTGSGGTASNPSGEGGYPPAGYGGYWPGTGGEPSIYDGGGQCAAIVAQGELVAPALLFLMDRSESMSCAAPNGGTRWTKLKGALAAFVNNGSTRNLGLEYFERETEADAGDAGDAGNAGDAGASCDPRDYRTPDVEIGPLNAAAVVESLDRHEPGGRTPTAAALTGAIGHVVDWGQANAGNHAAVALVTDGEPDICGSVADVADAAAAGLTSGVVTFVIGLIDSGRSCARDSAPASPKSLDAIAKAGGSRNAFMVDLAGAVDMEFVNALEDLVFTIPLACRYKLPLLPAGLEPQPDKINVAYSVPGSERRMLLRVSKGECDPKQGGWYYDDATQPAEIDICPESCSAIDAQRGSLEIFIDCPRHLP